MSTATMTPPAAPVAAGTGGTPARRAVLRWAWRLLRREWRQQILVLQLLTLAVAATVLGAGVVTNTPPPAAAGFGTADHLVLLRGPGLAAEVARLRQHFGTVDVIEEQPLVTGTTGGARLRAQDPAGAYGKPMLSLVSGGYPTGSGEAAMTPSLAGTLGLHVGDLWRAPIGDRRLVGLVENPQNLVDTFALVPPGQVAAPTQARVLFDATARDIAGYTFPAGVSAQTPQGNQGIDPTLVVLSVAVFGLVFVGLVAVAGFSVLAQRRLRALGMLSALGATDRHIRLVLIANGGVVGLIAAVAGTVIGLAAWLLYRPRLEDVAHHRIAWNALPGWLILAAMLLAVLTAVLAARHPARTVARMSVVAALAARPAPPRAAHRSAIPGLVLLAAGLTMVAFSGGWGTGVQSNTGLQIGGLLGTAIGLLLVAPACVTVLGPVARRAPVVVRLALRDLVRYRTRSGAALAAVSFAVFLAMVIGLLAGGRFADSLDYAGPNLPADELLIHSPTAEPDVGAGGPVKIQRPAPADEAALASASTAVAQAVGSSDVLPLQSTDATIIQGLRGDPGMIYVATPAVLAHYGIDPAAVDTGTVLITSRSGLDRLTGLHLIAGDPDHMRDVEDPKIQRFARLPTGASEPNLLVTAHGLSELGIQPRTGGWLITTPHPLTTAQIEAARQLAVGAGLTIETKSQAPSLAQLRTWATAAGVLLALAVLAMTVGLVRSETARDLVTLNAVGAARRTRRALTGITAGALGLLGAALGTVVAYLLTIALFRSQLSEKVSHVPVAELAAVLIGLPLIAAALAWLFAGREPATLARAPVE
jgi:putative ABC transport system permease protein